MKFVFLLVLLMPVIPIPITNIQIMYTSNFQIIEQDFPQLNFTDIMNVIVETILDLVWDFDGDSNFDGFLPLAFSYIPFLGSNGDEFTEIIFIFSVVAGVMVLAKVIHRAREARR